MKTDWIFHTLIHDKISDDVYTLISKISQSIRDQIILCVKLKIYEELTKRGE